MAWCTIWLQPSKRQNSRVPLDPQLLCRLGGNAAKLSHQPCSPRAGSLTSPRALPHLFRAPRRGQIARWERRRGCLWKTFSEVFATMPGPLFRRAHVSVRVLMQTREHLFAVMASRSSSVTFRCATDVALGSYHKEVNERSAPPVPFFRVDSRWISNWHTERNSSRTQQSEI